MKSKVNLHMVQSRKEHIFWTGQLPVFDVQQKIGRKTGVMPGVEQHEECAEEPLQEVGRSQIPMRLIHQPQDGL